MAEPFEARGEGLRLHVRLAPKAGRDAIEGVEAGADGRARLKVRVAAPPEAGKANRALLKLLARRLGVAPSRLAIVAGETSRTKTVALPAEARARLQALLAGAASVVPAARGQC